MGVFKDYECLLYTDISWSFLSLIRAKMMALMNFDFYLHPPYKHILLSLYSPGNPAEMLMYQISGWKSRSLNVIFAYTTLTFCLWKMQDGSNRDFVAE